MQPRSRSSRHELRTKDSLEKERLKHRSGGFYRHQDIRNPIDVHAACPSGIGNKERFNAGAFCEEVNHFEREYKKVVRDDVTEGRRARNLEREESRWRAISAQHGAQQGRVDRMQSDPMMGRKNVPGQPYNIVSQVYDKSSAGAQLEHHDNMVRYRSKVRTASLAMRNHLGFNPIIGEQTHAISIPPPPRPPPLALA